MLPRASLKTILCQLITEQGYSKFKDTEDNIFARESESKQKTVMRSCMIAAEMYCYQDRHAENPVKGDFSRCLTSGTENNNGFPGSAGEQVPD
jgi:hypothetical protein